MLELELLLVVEPVLLDSELGLAPQELEKEWA